MALMAVSDQQCPFTERSQFNSTGVHCGKMTTASNKLTMVLNTINDHRKTTHRLLVRLR